MAVDRESWQQEWRDQWTIQNGLLIAIRDALGGGLMTALDDLKAAVASNAEVSGRVADLVDTLQDQVAALQTSLDDLIAQGNSELQPLVDQVAAITAELTAAEAPNTPEPEPEA